ncbi:MAG: RNB domain-containing ribonuclease [Campylobacteraceae bacterium]
MENFLLSLTTGLKSADIPNDYKQTVTDLFHKKVLKLSSDIYKLDSNYRVGKLDVSYNGTGYLDVVDGEKSRKDLLIEPEDLQGASKGDFVAVKRVFAKNGRQKAKVIYVIQKGFTTIVGYTKEINKKTVVVNIKTALPVTVLSTEKSLKQLPLNTVLKIDNVTSNITEVLGVLDDPKVDEKISLALYNKVEFFSHNAEEEAKSYGDFVDKSMYPDRLDLTHLDFCTIDPPDAKDFDDAIYFDEEENALYVAIADVSEYVQPFGFIDKEAYDRGFSIYFPHKSIPMLPRSLSENICSLKPNEDRLTFGFKMFIDKSSLEVVRAELFNGIIHSKRRYTYDKIDEFLSGNFSVKDSVDDKILKWLLPLNKLANRLRKKRLINAFEFRSDEIRMVVDAEQNVIGSKVEIETASHSLIEECMLLANKSAAKRIDFGIFRTHEPPSFEKIQTLLDELAMIGIEVPFSPELPNLIRSIQKIADELNIRADVDKLIIKSQKQASYTPKNFGHFGLGFDIYSHFTSPIRRYSDLILHRLLKAGLSNDEKSAKFQLSSIETACEKISELERESDKVAYDYMDRKFARWAKDNIMNSFVCIVTEVIKTPIAKLDDKLKGARIFLMNDDVELFEKVMVSIVESDIASTKIIGRVVKRLD